MVEQTPSFDVFSGIKNKPRSVSFNGVHSEDSEDEESGEDRELGDDLDKNPDRGVVSTSSQKNDEDQISETSSSIASSGAEE